MNLSNNYLFNNLQGVPAKVLFSPESLLSGTLLGTPCKSIVLIISLFQPTAAGVAVVGGGQLNNVVGAAAAEDMAAAVAEAEEHDDDQDNTNNRQYAAPGNIICSKREIIPTFENTYE